MADNVTITGIFPYQKQSKKTLPLFVAKVSAGFPSPAEDFIEHKLDLNEFLIKHPSATFFVRVEGNSMVNAGIHSGDILIVDRALETVSNKIIIAVLNGELTVKRVLKRLGKLFLVPENPSYKSMEIIDGMEFEVWGVVTHVIHSL